MTQPALWQTTASDTSSVRDTIDRARPTDLFLVSAGGSSHIITTENMHLGRFFSVIFVQWDMQRLIYLDGPSSEERLVYDLGGHPRGRKRKRKQRGVSKYGIDDVWEK